MLQAEIEFRWLLRASTSGVCPVAASAVNSGEREEEEVGNVEESTQRRREVTAPGPGEEPPVL